MELFYVDETPKFADILNNHQSVYWDNFYFECSLKRISPPRTAKLLDRRFFYYANERRKQEIRHIRVNITKEPGNEQE